MSRCLCAVLSALVCLYASAESTVLRVANEGTDSETCGYPAQKCRSISQAILNASDGDTILVEVGIYGDLNRNGIIGEPGEEFCRYGVDCLIALDKRVTIVSERGAAVTIIDAGETGFPGVRIYAAGAVFGLPGMGFTVLTERHQEAGSGYHKGIQANARATIAGNRVAHTVWGIYTDGEADVYDNELTGIGGAYIGGAGIHVGKGGWIARNVVRAHTTGIETTDAAVEDNVIIDNVRDGLTIGGFATVTGNDIVRNGRFGIVVNTSGIVVQDNNIIGNDRDSSVGRGTACGLQTAASYVWAADNYWGSLGDADQACGGTQSIVVTDPMKLEPDGPR